MSHGNPKKKKKSEIMKYRAVTLDKNKQTKQNQTAGPYTAPETKIHKSKIPKRESNTNGQTPTNKKRIPVYSSHPGPKAPRPPKAPQGCRRRPSVVVRRRRRRPSI